MKPLAIAVLSLTLLTNPLAAEAEDRQPAIGKFLLLYVGSMVIGAYLARALSPDIPRGPGQITLTNGQDTLTGDEFKKSGLDKLESWECKLVSARFTYRFSGCHFQYQPQAPGMPQSFEQIEMGYETAYVSPNVQVDF